MQPIQRVDNDRVVGQMGTAMERQMHMSGSVLLGWQEHPVGLEITEAQAPPA